MGAPTPAGPSWSYGVVVRKAHHRVHFGRKLREFQNFPVSLGLRSTHKFISDICFLKSRRVLRVL
jgi:hypothetical protein